MKNPLRELRLRTKLALVMFLTMACAVVILIVTYVTYVHQEDRVKQDISTVAEELLVTIEAFRLEGPDYSDAKQILQAYTDAVTKIKGLKVDATSPDGVIQASSYDPKHVGEQIPMKGVSKQIAMKGVGKQIAMKGVGKQIPMKGQTKGKSQPRNFASLDVDQAVTFPVVHDSKVVGYLVVNGVPDKVPSPQSRTLLLLSVGILVAMLGLIMVLYLAFRFTKPIDALVRAANRVAQGNLEVSLPVSGADEMARLAETFNHMVERLRESRQLQERLNEAERTSLLGRLAATMAHEVRNSLNTFTLSADQIRAKHGGGDDRSARELQRYVAIIKDEVSRLNHLVNNVLAGRQEPPVLAPCDLRITLQEAMAMVEKQAHAQGIRISTTLPDQWPTLQADAAQIKTCFLNILTNAIQAMPLGGEIRISARTVSGNGSRGAATASISSSFELRVADTGPGIPSQERERVFSPFFSTKTTGFGLGLAITKKIVEDHQGRIYVDDDGPGTQMVVEFPLPQTPEVKREESKVES